MESHLLSWITFTPLIGMAIVLAMPKRSLRSVRIASLVATILPLVLATVGYFAAFQGGASEPRLVERFDWIRTIHAEYHVGIDGASLALVCISSLLCFLAVRAKLLAGGADKAFLALLLLLEVALLGAIVSLDFFLFFTFCELTLLPVCLSIGIWGGARGARVVYKLAVVALAGSMLILVALVALRLEAGTFSIPTLVELARTGRLTGANLPGGGSLLGVAFTTWCFWSLLAGYAIQFVVTASLLIAPRHFALAALALFAALGTAIFQLVELWRSMP